METILITGGTGLIASEQVKFLLREGHRVIVTYRDVSKFRRLGHSPSLKGIKIADLLAPNAVDEIIVALRSMRIRPTILVNSACDTRWHRMEADGHVAEECMINQYRINVVVPYELSWRLVNASDSKLKKIINISSMYGVVPHNPQLYQNPAVETPLQYSISKAALIHLTKDLSVRFRNRGVLVNTISYGGVEGRVDEQFKRRFEPLTPLGRMMTPNETIPALEFLINDHSGYMTGQNIIVDGGRTVW